MVLSADGKRLFVACANTNSVWAIDLASRSGRRSRSRSRSLPTRRRDRRPTPSRSRRTARRCSSPTPTTTRSPSSTSRGRARAASPASSRRAGIRRACSSAPTAGRFFVLSRQGADVACRIPRGPQPGAEGDPSQYVGAMLTGALSVLPTPDRGRAARRYTKTVRTRDARLRDVATGRRLPGRVVADSAHGRRRPRRSSTSSTSSARTAPTTRSSATCRRATAIRPCASSARTSRPTRTRSRASSCCSTTSTSTPRSATTATRSRPAAYATDFVEKIWPTNYAGRGGDVPERGRRRDAQPVRQPHGARRRLPLGRCARAGVTFRSYGEFGRRGDGATTMRDTGPTSSRPCPASRATSPDLSAPWDLAIPDSQRIDIWLEEFREFEAERQPAAPRRSSDSANDHTAGTRAGLADAARDDRRQRSSRSAASSRRSRRAGTGRTRRSSSSRTTRRTARTTWTRTGRWRFVISPFTRRARVDSTLYTTGRDAADDRADPRLPPMSQYDAAATPMYNAFVARPT